MDTLSIDSLTPFSISDLESQLQGPWRLVRTVGDGLGVRGDQAVVDLYVDPDSAGNGGCRLLVEYSDLALVKQVLERIANSPALMVDNDYGDYLPGDQFVARCKQDADWDWRR